MSFTPFFKDKSQRQLTIMGQNDPNPYLYIGHWVISCDNSVLPVHMLDGLWDKLPNLNSPLKSSSV